MLVGCVRRPSLFGNSKKMRGQAGQRRTNGKLTRKKTTGLVKKKIGLNVLVWLHKFQLLSF